MTVEKKFYTNPQSRTYAFTQRNSSFVLAQEHFISPFYVRRAIRRYLQLQRTNKHLIYIYDFSFNVGLACKAQYITRVNDLQQLYVNQRPSWEESFERLLNKLSALLPYLLEATTGLAKGTNMWIKIQKTLNNIYVY